MTTEPKPVVGFPALSYPGPKDTSVSHFQFLSWMAMLAGGKGFSFISAYPAWPT